MKKTLPIHACALFCVLSAFGQQQTKPEEKDFVAYLFAYFTGNKVEQEQVHFAVSNDGYSYTALNGNKPVIPSADISSTGGVRDPHIIRTADGRHFYMVLTDMTSSKGWDSNRAMVLLQSPNLTDWTASVINIQQKYAGQEDLKRVWAPQAIFDEDAKKYMVYWSMKHGDGPDVIHYAYANADFTDLETKPKPLFVPKSKKSCIDGDIVLKNGIYHLFYKTEGHGNGIKKALTDDLSSGVWLEQPDYKQQTGEAVEGSSVFRLTNSDKYILMYDVYMKGRYEFCESHDLDTFRPVSQQVTMDFQPRHGSIIPITKKELNHLLATYGTPETYTPPAANNPVLEGYHADPEILYAEKTGKFYLYPTSDGYTGWAGDHFKVFSSEDLRNWTDEGTILDLKKDVSWADRNAWAPCIIERKTGNNAYKYYYYFTAAQKIGVAVADHPTGPFRDSGRPLIAEKPEGIRGGQEIDPDVFADPLSGKSYLYWGNGYAAVAELNEDMVSLKPGSTKVITPDGTFREGLYVFSRNGIYYFLWSEDDTRSADYRVRYGTSTSPIGPIKIPENNLILSKLPEKGIYGTGHNSVLQLPGTDEWYIVYHRFSRPNGIRMGEAAGYHREVCIDRMEFDENGGIKPVVPTN